MKKYLIISFVLFVQFTFAQNIEKNIKETFETYVGLTTALKFDEAMDYVIEDMFQLISKAQLIRVFEETFNSEEFEFEFVDYSTSNYRKPFVYKDATYVVFTNSMTNKMKFNSTDENETEEEKIEFINFMKSTFIASYGKSNVSYDEETGFFTLNMKKAVCAKSFNGISDWKFVNIELDKKEIFQKILPKKVFKLAKN